MEQLLLLLFLLFSVVSALLERRKRKQQLEEAQKRQQERKDQGEADGPSWEDEEDEEDWGGWPMAPGDPFEQPSKSGSARQTPEPTEEAIPQATADAQTILRELEYRARQAEQQATAQQQVAEQRQQQVQRPKPLAQLLRKTEPEPNVKARPRRGRRYHLSPASARDAIVYAEILGPCKALKQDDERA